MISESYIQLSLAIPREQYDLMVAVLSDIDYYAFEETPAALRAYILERDYDEARFQGTVEAYFPGMELGMVRPTHRFGPCTVHYPAC